MHGKKRIGIIGFGKIGSYLIKELKALEEVKIKWIFDADEKALQEVPGSLRATSWDKTSTKEVDLVVETANFKAVEEFAPEVLKTVDMAIMSTTALADKNLLKDLKSICRKNSSRLFVPHGAILGLDGIQDGKSSLESVKIVTTKPPQNLDYSFTEKWNREDIKNRTILYEGPTYNLCQIFPRNVNVHASIALAGLGFQDTYSKLIADPETDKAQHSVEARGPGLTLQVQKADYIEGVTGTYTLESTLNSLKRILDETRTIQIY